MIFDFWQEHLEEFSNLLDKQDFSPQEIGRYKAMIERFITQGKSGTWKSYDDVSNYYNERTDLAKSTRYSYLSIINKLQSYHINGELPVHRTHKGTSRNQTIARENWIFYLPANDLMNLFPAIVMRATVIRLL